MNRNELRWGVIGCGDVCEVKSAPAMNKIHGSRLVAVTRRDLRKAHDYARRHQVPIVCESPEELIAHPEVDIVYIATPPDSHARYTIATAKAGKPVYVEKPMARNANECRSMIEACRQADVHLFVAYYRRCLPVFLKVKELLDSGVIGAVRFISMDLFSRGQSATANSAIWRLQPDISGGGLFFDLGSHQLDLLDFLFGPAQAVRGYAINQAGQSPAEDLVLAQLSFANAVQASARWCFSIAKEFERDLVEIFGEKGRIRFSIFGDQVIQLQTTHSSNRFNFERPEHIQQPFIETIVAQLNGRGLCPSTGETALRTARIMDSLVASYRQSAGIEFPDSGANSTAESGK